MSSTRAHWHSALVAALCLLPVASAGDTQRWQWNDGRQVRVATYPTLRPFPDAPGSSPALPTIAHGYAELVARHSGLTFIDTPYDSLGKALMALCTHEADLILVQGSAVDHKASCDLQTGRRGFPGAVTALAGRNGTRLPRDADGLDAVVLAAVQGGAYPAWLAQQANGINVLPMPNFYAALAAVEAGAADAAIGMETSLRPVVRRHFSAGLKLQTIRSGFPDQLHLLARADDRMLLDRVEQGLDRISLEEHAILGHRWATRTLPASIADVSAQTAMRTSSFILPLAMLTLLALGGLWLRRRFGARQRQRSLSQASAVGMLSHEVRNSAHLVISALDLLRQQQLPASARDLVNAANRATLELRGRLNRALDFSRLAAGTFQPKPCPCDAADIASQALDAVSPEAQRKGLTLHLDVSPQPLPGLELDPDCLRQLLDNLLGNAIKFTDAGGIELRVQMLADADAAHLLVDVIDSGIGIAPAQMAVLFQPFQPGDEVQARGGSGLGLSICRELARSMGGALDVHSVQGRGSRFSLRLPATVIPLPDAQVASAAPPIVAPLLAGVDVLLVEDHALSRRVLAAQLRKQGATVHEVSSAGAALLCQATAQHAVILLDIELGQSTGYALAPQLRKASMDKGQTTQILALSAHTGAAHQQCCLQAGFDGVLSKPLQLDALLQALGRGDAGATPDVHDRDTLAPEMAEDLRREHAATERAARARDSVALAHHAHRLHGALQMQGLHELAAMAATLAQLGRERTPDWGAALHLVDQLRDVNGPGTTGAVQLP
ncbi:ATP-binding protein [Stenotrophomonas sp. YAU14D1_LEIMI4_1]|uniref:ATP-binding protein n=1 Tax=Stenotrophomonas sp. YAU14D1_LEIMI4_1 TaxID=2072407 RepID=UPI000D53C7C5|nr:ATP-binding protein [Stenotrophomonas sp. YAU14D1_LEIMI4_1]AWH25363.1 transcriptional regulator [Stenotrophomonas sp. YAU14D1_LEIMI4_1]